MLRSAIPRLHSVRLQAAIARPASASTSSVSSGVSPDYLRTQPSSSSVSWNASRNTRCFATADTVVGTEKQGSQAAGGSSTSNDAQEGDSSGSQISNQVSISFRGATVLAHAGTKLRTAMLRGGISPHNGKAQIINCRGLGTCGTCAVEVQKGQVQPAEWSGTERLRLSLPPHSAPNNQRLRLACQVSCESDLELVKYDGFWGQGSVPRGPILAGEIMQEPMLGELEYVMDAKERKRSVKKQG